MALPKEKERYTYADYAAWDDSERWELIDGEAYAMSPAPSPTHQMLSGELYRQFANYLKGKACKVFNAPFDVRLNYETDDDTVLQPDLLVICDSGKLDSKGCNGAPDLVIEVLSPSTAPRDKVLKFNQYLNAGVREYWIVDPDSKSVSVNVLDNGRYIASAYASTDTVPVHVLDGCTISMPDVFEE